MVSVALDTPFRGYEGECTGINQNDTKPHLFGRRVACGILRSWRRLATGLDIMKRSDRRVLTSHVGSLPRPDALIEINRAKFAGEAYDASVFATRLSAAVE